MKEECGIFGTYQKEKSFNTSNYVINGLSDIQHRGQESSGISYFTNKGLTVFKNMGLVKEVFSNYTSNNTNMCIGHVRYSTSKSSISSLEDAQPFRGSHLLGEFSIVHNGHIPNLDKNKHIRKEDYSTDSDFLVKYIERSTLTSWENILIDIMNTIPGVYCLLVMTCDSIYVLRDRYGIRPLCIGRNKEGIYVSSESCAIEYCDFIVDVEPGQILQINDNIYSIYKYPSENLHCIFEFIYFSNSKSILDGCNVENIRKDFGRKLAQQDLYLFDKNSIVVGSPSSGILAGKGYAEESGLQYKQVLIKNKDYIRSFIMPNQKERLNICQNKFKLDIDTSGYLKDKTIILVDDSIVRGNTMKHIVSMFLKEGVKEIHVRSASPPIKYPCYFGIDISSSNELIANRVLYYDGLAKYFNSTSLDYLTQKNIEDTIHKYAPKMGLCGACFNGNYEDKLLNW